MQIGRAAGQRAFRAGRAETRPSSIGRDTRLSGTMLESALVAGLTSAGYDAISLGIVPTPGVACVTRAVEAAAGIVISASHNPIEDNGIKIFGPDGFKLSDEIESRIEASLAFARPAASQRHRGRHRARRAESRPPLLPQELYEGDGMSLAKLPRDRRRRFRRGVCDCALRAAEARGARIGDTLRSRRRAH